jgi:hypothetical protein
MDGETPTESIIKKNIIQRKATQKKLLSLRRFFKLVAHTFGSSHMAFFAFNSAHFRILNLPFQVLAVAAAAAAAAAT